MGRKGVGAFTSQNTVLQNNVIMINVPKAIDKTNFNTDADQINYQSRFVAQPIYCHESAGNYIAIDDTDAQVTTAWASLSVEESGDVLTSTALVPAFSTDMKIQLEVRAVDDTETLYSKVITTIDMFALKNDSADFIVNNISWKNDNVTVKAQVKDSGFSLPANIDKIRGNGTLTAAFNTWRYDLAAIFGDINYKVLYSIKETDFPYPNTLANNFNLRTWDWANDGIEFTLNDLNQENNYQIKLILDRDGLSESSGAIMHNNRPETAIELIIQSGTSSFQIANNGIRSTYPNPNDKASTASAMLARTQQHSNEENVEKGHSVALYDSHIRTGESIAANEPSIGFMTMNHEEIGKIGVESLRKSDGTSIGKHIVLRNDDMEMPVAVRTSGNRLQYWDEGLDIWQDILPAKMVSGMNEHIQWDFTGGESGDEPIVIHMKGMTFTSKDGFKFTTGALTPDSLSVELKEELRGKSLRLNTSNTVFVYDADNNPFPSGQIIDLTVDVQGITGSVDWNIKGYNVEGTEVSIPTTIINNKHIKIDIDSMGNNVQKIVATVSLENNGEKYTDTLTLLKLKNGLDGVGRGVKSISEWLLSTNKNTGVTKADLGWTKDGYPEINKSKPYLWKYTSIVYSDDSVEETEPVLVGAFGIDGRSVSKVESYYATSTRASGVAVADLTWVKTPVNPTNEQPYLWNYDRIVYTDSVNPTILGPRVIGVKGKDGKDGIDGIDGLQGPRGEQGIQGPKGANGVSSYTHIAYANNSTGTSGFSVSDSTNKSYIGMYVDSISTDSTDPTKYKWTLIKGLDGQNGTPGPKGDDGRTPYLHIAYATNATGTTGFSTTVSAGKTYIGQYTDFTEADSTDPAKYSWTLIKGDKGEKGDKGVDGLPGKDGVGLASTDVSYIGSTSGTSTPTSGWITTIPTVAAGNYLWTKTVWTYTDGKTETGYSVSRIGKDGNSGKDGIAGKDGVGLTSTTITYSKHTNGTTPPTTGWGDQPPSANDGEFIWTKTVWTYTDGTSETGYSVGKIGAKGATGATGPQGTKGEKGDAGKDGISITSVDVEYAKNKSKTTPPTIGWTTSAPQWESGSYIWQRIKTTYSDGNSTYLEPHAIETDAANSLTDYVASRGLNLVTNGTGMLKDNTNFPGFTFDGSQAYASDGSFLYKGSGGVLNISESIPVDANLSYRLNYYIKGDVEEQPEPVRGHGYVVCVDIDGNLISPQYTMYFPGTTTKLARDLNIGDTKIYLEDSSGWGTSESTDKRSVVIWGYKNSYGYEYPTETYSRYWAQDLWENASSIDKANHVITLKSPWKLGNFPKGRELSNGSSGGTYKYIAGSNFIIEKEWTNYSGTIGGIDTTGTNISNKFHPGTSSIKIGWLLNRYANISTWISNVSFMLDNASQSDLNDTKEQVKKTVKTITEEYYQSTSATSQTGSDWTTEAPTWKEGKFIFIRSKITYVDGTTSYTPIVNITGAKGDTGPKGVDGKSINNITDYYLATSASTGVTTATAGWSTTIPTLTETNKYLWRYEKINYINPTSSSNTTPVIIGMFSKDGNNGAAGRGISSITNYYKLTNTTTTPAIDTSWGITPLTTTTTNRYLWNYEKIVYINPAGTTNTTPAIISTHGATGDTGATGPKGEDGRHGIDLSMGEMVYKDPSFLNGMNEIVPYSNNAQLRANLTVTRVASSADNPVVSPYMLEVKTTSAQVPGFGGVHQLVRSRKKAVYVHRLIAKIPVGRRLYLADNLGNNKKYTYLTSMDGTGYFEEYLIKVETTPNAVGDFGYFYVNGGATPTEAEPLTWYIAYLTTFDLYVGSTLQANHTWVKYGNANGVDMSDTPNRLTHIGIATNKFTDIPSKKASDYSWAVFSASTVPDPIIPDKHVWFKFADNEYGEGMSSNPTGKSWVGIALNKTSVAATSAASDYEWRQIYKVQTSTQPFKPIGAAPGHLWIDTSVSPPVIKKYNGDVWENIADTSELLAEISNKVDSATAQQIAQDMGMTILNEVQATFQSLSSDMNGFSMEFTEYQTLVDSSLSELGVRINETKDYINFVDGKIILGTTQNNFSVEISNEKISFKDGGEEVAYINNQELFINDARVQKKLTFGVESGDKIVGFFVESNGLFLRRM